jgi:hypothetical protein
VEFGIEYYDMKEVKVEVEEEEAPFGQVLLRAKSGISSFIRPFDISQAPLLRVGIITTKESKNLLAIDMHSTI